MWGKIDGLCRLNFLCRVIQSGGISADISEQFDLVRVLKFLLFLGLFHLVITLRQLSPSRTRSTVFNWVLFSEDDAEVKPLVDKRGLNVLENLVDLVDFHCLHLTEELIDKVSDRQHLLVVIRWVTLLLARVVLLPHYLKEHLKYLSIDIDACPLKHLDELLLFNVAVPSCVNRSQCLLKGEFLVGEDLGPEVVEDLLGPVQGRQVVEVQLLPIVILQERYLYDTSVVRVKFVEDGVDFLIGELPPLLLLAVRILSLNVVIEVLNKALTCAEVIDTGLIERVTLKVGYIEAALPDVVRELLNTLLGPSLGASEELPGVLLLELFNRLFELDLRSSEWVDLHKLLQIEERLGYTQLVTAAGGSQEVLELVPIG